MNERSVKDKKFQYALSSFFAIIFSNPGVKILTSPPAEGCLHTQSIRRKVASEVGLPPKTASDNEASAVKW